MPESVMKLDEQHFEQIGRYVRENLPEWLGEVRAAQALAPGAAQTAGAGSLQTAGAAPTALNIELVRVQEEIKSNRLLIERHFEFTEKRFEAVDKKFEAVDKRFEMVDKRFEELRSDMNARFGEVRSDMNARFEMVDKRFDDLGRSIRTSQWMVGLLLTLFLALNTAVQILV